MSVLFLYLGCLVTSQHVERFIHTCKLFINGNSSLGQAPAYSCLVFFIQTWCAIIARLFLECIRRRELNNAHEDRITHVAKCSDIH